MLMTYLKIGGAVAIVGAAYLLGDSAGANRVIARDAKEFARIDAAKQRIEISLGVLRLAAAGKRQEQRTIFREIYRDVPTIIDRPVYRTVCGDADGVLLLDRAADAANGLGRAASAPSGAPQGPTGP